MEPHIIIIAEYFQQNIRPVSFELVSFALELQRIKGLPIKVIMLGDKIEEPA